MLERIASDERDTRLQLHDEANATHQSTAVKVARAMLCKEGRGWGYKATLTLDHAGLSGLPKECLRAIALGHPYTAEVKTVAQLSWTGTWLLQ